jgi:hypothetical protein
MVAELDSLRREHEDDNQETLLATPGKGKRLFKKQDVSRTLGDAWGKHSVEEMAKLEQRFAFDSPLKNAPYVSPPYILNTPDVISRTLQPAPGEQLKFVILATDGRMYGLGLS